MTWLSVYLESIISFCFLSAAIPEELIDILQPLSRIPTHYLSQHLEALSTWVPTGCASPDFFAGHPHSLLFSISSSPSFILSPVAGPRLLPPFPCYSTDFHGRSNFLASCIPFQHPAPPIQSHFFGVSSQYLETHSTQDPQWPYLAGTQKYSTKQPTARPVY